MQRKQEGFEWKLGTLKINYVFAINPSFGRGGWAGACRFLFARYAQGAWVGGGFSGDKRDTIIINECLRAQG